MIYAPAYAFHSDHPAGEPGTVRFMGCYEGAILEKMIPKIAADLSSDESAMVYPTGCESIEVYPDGSYAR